MIARTLIGIWYLSIALLFSMALVPVAHTLHPLTFETRNMLVQITSYIGIVAVGGGIILIVACAWTDWKRVG